jgi:myo-inositol-1(or 4)-monophosphatase
MSSVSSKYIADSVIALGKSMRNSRAELLTHFGSIKHTVKPNHTIVTEMDSLIESRLTSELLNIDTDVGILGEELGQQGSSSVYWLIDPIDGTEQFVRGLSGCVNMACLIDDNRPIASVIYDFIHDELYTAVEGLGAQKNESSIQVSNRPLNRAWVEFAFRKGQSELMPLINKLAESVSIVRLRNSLLVSTGKVDGLVTVDGKGGLWDYAPRVLMIQEAGGKVANIGSDNYDFHNTSFIASNPVIYEDLQKIMTS